MNNCPDFLTPRLRLFLSADIIGSTAQKQSKLGAIDSGSSPNDPSWFTTIQGFYFEAQQSVRNAWAQLKHPDLSDDHVGDAPVLWKTVGDEVLFTKLVTDHRQVLTTVHCWINVITEMRAFLHREGKGRLGVKSTIWLAGFPLRNKEVVLSGERFSDTGPIEDYFTENGRILNKYYSEKTSSSINIDYIGPSIDTGFRLTSFASARKLVVSIEVAYILALTARMTDEYIQPVDMRFDGEFVLKGVLGGGGYPVFWIDLSNSGEAAVHADALLGVGNCDRDTISKYCAAFFHENAELIFPPFVVSKSEGLISATPKWYDEQLANLIKWFNPNDDLLDAKADSIKDDDEGMSQGDPNFSENLRNFSVVIQELANRYREFKKDNPA